MSPAIPINQEPRKPERQLAFFHFASHLRHSAVGGKCRLLKDNWPDEIATELSYTSWLGRYNHTRGSVHSVGYYQQASAAAILRICAAKSRLTDSTKLYARLSTTGRGTHFRCHKLGATLMSTPRIR
eukprot:6485231-Amphidinium_carterae.1